MHDAAVVQKLQGVIEGPVRQVERRDVGATQEPILDCFDETSPRGHTGLEMRLAKPPP
jgi:hypothetical protein